MTKRNDKDDTETGVALLMPPMKLAVVLKALLVQVERRGGMDASRACCEQCAAAADMIEDIIGGLADTSLDLSPFGIELVMPSTPGKSAGRPGRPIIDPNLN